MLTGGLLPGEVAATGMILGAVLLALGATGAIGRLARLIPQSVTVGLQLGLGLSMAALGLGLVLETPWLGLGSLVLLLLLVRRPRWPAAPLTLLVGTAVAWLAGVTTLPAALEPAFALPAFSLPDTAEAWRGLTQGALPQLPLTLTNAVLVTAALCHDLYPARAARASVRNLALSTGVANLVLCPFGAMPMCHGAGGVQAQHRFGARTGLAPVLLGTVLLVLALGLADSAAALLAAIPAGAVGALLLVAGGDLAFSRRLLDARPSCWPVIGVTAAATLLASPALALLSGWLVELARAAVAREALRRPRFRSCDDRPPPPS
jgi:MFS superfamily sulfate permease-like transporter